MSNQPNQKQNKSIPQWIDDNGLTQQAKIAAYLANANMGVDVTKKVAGGAFDVVTGICALAGALFVFWIIFSIFAALAHPHF